VVALITYVTDTIYVCVCVRVWLVYSANLLIHISPTTCPACLHREWIRGPQVVYVCRPRELVPQLTELARYVDMYKVKVGTISRPPYVRDSTTRAPECMHIIYDMCSSISPVTESLLRA